jgi:hypothetical protein
MARISGLDLFRIGFWATDARENIEFGVGNYLGSLFYSSRLIDNMAIIFEGI